MSSLALTASVAQAGKCPNVQIVMDRSGSMESAMDASNRWDVCRSTLKGLAASLDMTFPLGISIFPDTGLVCGPGAAVRPAYGTKTLIGNALDAQRPDGTSSSGSAVKAVAMLSDMRDASRPQYMILLTDGTPTCMGEPDSVLGAANELEKAYAQTPSIATFVVGIGALTMTDASAVTELAIAGHRTRPAGSKYYPAETGTQLMNSLLEIGMRISSEVGTCSDTTPTDMRSGSEDLRGVTDLRLPDGSPPVEIDLRIPGTGEDGGTNLPAPVVDWIEPKTMMAGMGGPAEITGRNFVAALPSSQVFFDSGSNLSTVPNALVVDGSTIKVLVPADLAPGTYDIVVKNPDGQLGRAEAGFTVSGKATGCACSIGSGHANSDGARTSLWASAVVAMLCCLALRRRARRLSQTL